MSDAIEREAKEEAERLVANAGPCELSHRYDLENLDLPAAMTCDACVTNAVAARLAELKRALEAVPHITYRYLDTTDEPFGAIIGEHLDLPMDNKFCADKGGACNARRVLAGKGE